MRLYHGSSSRDIKQFSFKNSRKKLDFGKGVYFTSNFEQAKEWSCHHGKQGAVYECELDLSRFKLLMFDKEEANLIYILYLCRIGLEEIVPDAVDDYNQADIIIGPLLDGSIKGFEKLAEQFNAGDLSFSNFSDQIKLFTNGKNQYCIKTINALKAVNASIQKVYFTKRIHKNKIDIVEERTNR